MILKLKTLAVLLLLALSSPLWAGKPEMKPVYLLKWTPEHAPKIYPLPIEMAKNMALSQICRLPFPNAVGTNDLNNAITKISFGERAVSFEILRKDFLKYVSGGGPYFAELFSQSVIGYTQVRSFILFDVHTGYFRVFMITPSLSMSIDKVAVFDPSQALFLFETNKTVPNPYADPPETVPPALHGEYYELILVDVRAELLEQTHKVEYLELPDEPWRVKARHTLAEKLEIDETFTRKRWLVADKKIFIYGKEPGMEVYDGNFHRVDHPLLRIYDTIKEQIGEVRNLIVHPTLPFAVLVAKEIKKGDYESNTWVLTWREGAERNAYRMFDGVGNLSFSPDGRWLVFSSGDIFVSAVDEKLKFYLGPPIKLGSSLGTGMDYRKASAWAYDPQAWAVTNHKEIYYWEINDQAIRHKYEYTKDNVMPQANKKK